MPRLSAAGIPGIHAGEDVKPAIDLKTPGSSRSSNYQPTDSAQIAKTKRNQQIQMPIKTVLRHLPAIIFRLWLWWPVRKLKMAQIALKLATKAFRRWRTSLTKPGQPEQ